MAPALEPQAYTFPVLVNACTQIMTIIEAAKFMGWDGMGWDGMGVCRSRYQVVTGSARYLYDHKLLQFFRDDCRHGLVWPPLPVGIREMRHWGGAGGFLISDVRTRNIIFSDPL